MSPKPERVESDESPVVLGLPARPVTRASVQEQYQRNMEIIDARIRRVPWSKIAAQHGLTVRRCHYIWDEWKGQNPTLRENDPIEIVDELLYGYQAAIEDAQAVAGKTNASGQVVVAALNTKLRAYREMAELLQAIGVLPNDLGTMHLHIDGQITAERVIAVLDRFGVPEAVYDGILDALGGPVQQLSAPDIDATE